MQESGKHYDLSTLFEIASGNNEFIIETIDLFISQSQEFFQDLAEGVQEKDWARVASTAHKMKANLGFFGMYDAEKKMNQIETSGRLAEHTETIEPAFIQLRAVVFEAIEELEQLKRQKAAEL